MTVQDKILAIGGSPNIMNDDIHYKLIYRFYEGKYAKRSGVAYIDHIDEGFVIADHLGFEKIVKQAFCLHPMLQADEALEWAFHQRWVIDVDPYALCLAMEYRKAANSYLPPNVVGPTDKIQLSPLKEVRQMLIMDKVQNRKDFEKYHKKTHAARERLGCYFKNWTARLGVSNQQYEDLVSVLDPSAAIDEQ